MPTPNATKATAEQVGKRVIYPKLEVLPCWGSQAITETKMKEILGWETEEMYAERVRAEKPNAKASQVKFGDVFLLKDEEGNKVRCRNDAKNRPYDDGHARKLAQDVLTLNWAGPSSMRGKDADGLDFTVNGETIIIDRYGEVDSGQHRGIGFILACQLWRKHKDHWMTNWPDPPVLDVLIVRGVSRDPKVLRTLDNVKPRSLADVFYTSGLLDNLKPAERQEMSRMLDSAIDVLWKRTQAGSSAYTGKQTHAESMNFFERHKKIKEFVKLIHKLNSDDGRAISAATGRVQPGTCAALAYLMAASATQPDDYYPDGRTEKVINWERLQTANAYWEMLADDNPRIKPVRDAIRKLVGDDDEAMTAEKIATLILGWGPYYTDSKINPGDLKLEWNEETGKLLDHPIIEGIDKGPSKAVDPHMTEEQIQEARRKLEDDKLREKAEKAKDGKGNGKPAPTKPKGSGSPAAGIAAQLDALAAEHPGHLIGIRTSLQAINFFRADAGTVKAELDSFKVKSTNIHREDGMEQVNILKDDVPAAIKVLTKKHEVAVVGPDGKLIGLGFLTASAKPEPTPAPKNGPGHKPVTKVGATKDINGRPLQTKVTKPAIKPGNASK